MDGNDPVIVLKDRMGKSKPISIPVPTAEFIYVQLTAEIRKRLHVLITAGVIILMAI